MSIEPKLEPAFRPGVMTASVAGAAVIGILIIDCRPEIKALPEMG